MVSIPSPLALRSLDHLKSARRSSSEARAYRDHEPFKSSSVPSKSSPYTRFHGVPSAFTGGTAPQGESPSSSGATPDRKFDSDASASAEALGIVRYAETSATAPHSDANEHV